jgi:hypothetical protein
MTLVNKYGHYTDTPVDKAWYLQFEVLFLSTQHRKILNRQPEVRSYKQGNEIYYFSVLEWKVMSN